MRSIDRTALFVLAVIALAVPMAASAQGLAVRAGANVNPDQVYFGGQYDVGPFTRNIWFQPTADLGIGNGAKLAAFDFDVAIHRALDRRSVWTAYAGGGPAIDWYHFPTYNSSGWGFNVLGGVLHQSGMFVEIRAGMGNSPDMRLGAGYMLRPPRPAQRPAPRPRGRRR